MLKSKTRWNIQQSNEVAVEKLAHELNIPPLIATLLVNRDIVDPIKAKEFLFTESQSFHDPFLLYDMEKAVQRIFSAIENKEKILIYGDYDADGVTSTVLMITTLKKLGANASFYIPNRFTEGYGPNKHAFKKAYEEGFRLLITVDNGIVAIDEAKFAKELGIDLIITDHHEPGPTLPPSFATIHPKHPNGQYPFPDLAGVGVAFKLAHALYGRVPEELLDLVAIGTIADLVPLHDENRLLTKKGLQKLQTTERLGIKTLCEQMNVNISDINEETVGFSIGPRLNAVGRLDNADPAVHLLLTNNEEEALQLSEDIEQMNTQRKDIVHKITDEALSFINDSYLEKNRVLVIGKEGWNQGVIGIVASRLSERFYRPTIVLSYDKEKKIAKGSGRSIEGFDLFAHLSACRDILPHFGGHQMAAGMTLLIDDVDKLRERLNDAAKKQLREDDYIPITNIDASIQLDDVSLDSIKQLDLLAPFGVGNPKPKVTLTDINCLEMRKIGADRTHLKVIFEEKETTLEGVGFGMGEYVDHISPLASVSVVGELAINEWNNVQKPQIFIKDLSVNEWQLFDLRGKKQLEKWLPSIPEEQRKLVIFQKETFHRISVPAIEDDIYYIRTEEDAEQFITNKGNIVLLDLPPNETILEKLLQGEEPQRIYAHFHHEHSHFFSMIPTREHFKWFYAFLVKNKVFHLEKFAEKLASLRGWSRETIHFMSQVFFELDFVKMENGFISIKPVKGKRDLTESPTYKRKQMQYRLEKNLLLSSRQELKLWFDHKTQWSVTHEEEVAEWI